MEFFVLYLAVLFIASSVVSMGALLVMFAIEFTERFIRLMPEPFDSEENDDPDMDGDGCV